MLKNIEEATKIAKNELKNIPNRQSCSFAFRVWKDYVCRKKKEVKKYILVDKKSKKW